MFNFRNFFRTFILIGCTFFICFKKEEVVKLAHIVQKNASKFIYNIYVSYLDNKDPNAIDEFIFLYKKTLISLGRYNELNVGPELMRIKRLFEKNNLIVAVAHNLLGGYVGYMAIDLKTGHCISYEIIFTECNFMNNFSILYKIMLQDVEHKCKERYLKELIIPISESNSIFYDTLFYREKKSKYSANLIEDQHKSVLAELGYKPLQSASNCDYTCDEAWFKKL